MSIQHQYIYVHFMLRIPPLGDKLFLDCDEQQLLVTKFYSMYIQ